MELGLPFESYVEQYRYKYLALYHAIRAAIHSGSAGRNPTSATRELAKAVRRVQGSAAQCYDMLMAEGYVVSRQARNLRGRRDSWQTSDHWPSERRCSPLGDNA